MQRAAPRRVSDERKVHHELASATYKPIAARAARSIRLLVLHINPARKREA